MDRATLQEILYSALHSEMGVVVETNDVVRARAQLYGVRREIKDPDLEILEFRLSPDQPKKQIWIVKKGSINAPQTQPG